MSAEIGRAPNSFVELCTGKFTRGNCYTYLHSKLLRTFAHVGCNTNNALIRSLIITKFCIFAFNRLFIFCAAATDFQTFVKTP